MAEAQIVLRAVDATRAAFASVNSSLSGLQRSAMSLRGMLGGLGVALSAGGFAAFVKSSIDAADNLGKMSQRVGVTVENLSALQYAAKLSDVSTEQLSAGLGRLAFNMQKAAAGTGEARQAFAALGISQQELARLSPEQGLERIADAFSKMEDGAGKTALAWQIFGEAGSRLIPLLNSGSSGLAQFRAEAERLGIVISGETARAAEQFNDNLTRLQTAMQGISVGLMSSIVGQLAELTTNFLAAADAAGSFGKALDMMLSGRASDPLKRLAEVNKQIRILTEQRSAIEGSAANRSFLRDVPMLGTRGDLEQLDKRLAALREEQAVMQKLVQARTAAAQASQRGAQARATAPALPASTGGARGNPDAALFEEARIAQGIQDRDFREFERRLDEIASLRAEVEREADAAKIALLQEGPDVAAAGIARDLSRLESRLSGTTTERIKQLQRELQLLAAEGAKAPVEMQDAYAEAFEQINAEMQQLKGLNTDGFGKIAEDGKKAFADLEFAVQGWGRQFTDTLADAVMTGKLDFKSLADSIIRDLLRMYIQMQITAPLLQAAGGMLPGLSFGGARALGGPVSAGTAYLVGERGPELFVPRQSGAIVPNGAGGVTVNQSMTFNGNADAGTLSAWARQVQASTIATIKDQIKRGDRAYAVR